tara:strand:- start:274 stop:525 length:252 start_codon:yes stop_codon:yes gene_type:complete
VGFACEKIVLIGGKDVIVDGLRARIGERSSVLGRRFHIVESRGDLVVPEEGRGSPSRSSEDGSLHADQARKEGGIPAKGVAEF